MINNSDLNKTRYTHRDYDSIKSDLINAIPSLTQEWTNREESDPGIVLIKLMAMFGDTLSYNIDKIALELYLSSVTQRKNVSKILALLGYKTHWYRSGRVLAHVRLISEYDEDGNREHTILVPYQTSFNANGISYTVVGKDEIDIYSSSSSVPVELVEGSPINLSFNQSSLVNNRYYFNRPNVDETEIRLEIEGSSSVQCRLIDSLYLAADGSIVYYEFNVDEYDRPYIQLVDNWQDIVRSSDDVVFNLSYILSSGANGNITSNAFAEVYGAKEGNTFGLIITNLPNTTNYYKDGVNIDTFNSPGYDPQTVDEAKKDGSFYTFTHDTLVSSSDYEKACRRVNNITIAKLVDAQVIINDDLNLEELIHRALDNFTEVAVEEDDPSNPGTTVTNYYLSPYQVILYLAYKNFNQEMNAYYSSAAISGNSWSLDPNDDVDPYDSPFNEMKCGYYPYKPNDNILRLVREDLSGLQLVCRQTDFGTMKLFPFKVKGTLHLMEPMSPSETLQVVEIVDSTLEEKYYPDLHPIGEKPNFIELVDVIQGSDVRIKYFDAIGSIVEWAPPVKTLSDFNDNIVYTKSLENEDSFEVPDHPSSIIKVTLDGEELPMSAFSYNTTTYILTLTDLVVRGTVRVYYNRNALSDATLYFDDVFDTTSAIMYNGLDEEFNLAKRFLKYKFKNVGVTAEEDASSDYGTAYLTNYSREAGLVPVVTIGLNSIKEIQCNNIKELQALCDDIKFNGNALLAYDRVYDMSQQDPTQKDIQTYDFVFSNTQALDQETLYTSSYVIPNSSNEIFSMTYTGNLLYITIDSHQYLTDDPGAGTLTPELLAQLNLEADNTNREITVTIEYDVEETVTSAGHLSVPVDKINFIATVNGVSVLDQDINTVYSGLQVGDVVGYSPIPECEMTYCHYTDTLHEEPVPAGSIGIYKLHRVNNTGLVWMEE